VHKIRYFELKCIICNGEVEIKASKLGVNGIDLTFQCKNRDCKNEETLIKILKERKKPNIINIATSKVFRVGV